VANHTFVLGGFRGRVRVRGRCSYRGRFVAIPSGESWDGRGHRHAPARCLARTFQTAQEKPPRFSSHDIIVASQVAYNLDQQLLDRTRFLSDLSALALFLWPDSVDSTSPKTPTPSLRGLIMPGRPLVMY
jgi:hypothetical protein